jgi:hypothetical protein
MISTFRKFRSTGANAVYSENATVLEIKNKVFYGNGNYINAIDVTGNYDQVSISYCDFFNYEYSGWGSGNGDRAIAIGGSLGNIKNVRKITVKNCRFFRCYKGVHLEYFVNEEMNIEDLFWLNSNFNLEQSQQRYFK